MRESEKRIFEDSKLVQDFLKKVPDELGREVTSGVDSKGNFVITIKTSTGTVTRKQHKSPGCYRRVGD